jgi:hypothetical protein
VFDPGVINPHALRLAGVGGSRATLRLVAGKWQAGFEIKPAFARGLRQPLVGPAEETDTEDPANYDTQPFYAPWAFKAVGLGNWGIRQQDEVLPFNEDPSWSEERRYLRRKLWEKNNTCYAYFVRKLFLNYGRVRSDRILHYLLSRYKEHLEMAKPEAESRPPKLWDYENDREMSPALKLRLWMNLGGSVAGTAAPKKMA